MALRPAHAWSAIAAGLLAWAGAPLAWAAPRIELGTLAKVAEVDPNFQSFNVEMVEVTGGRFWAPYDTADGSRYAERRPLDLSNSRLRNLAKALAPAFMRVSGTWANTTYVPTLTEVEPAGVPPGFRQVLRRSQWQALVDFSSGIGLPIITSFPAGEGARDASGQWRSDQAARLLSLTERMGGRIAAAEFFNEPNLARLGGLPAGYGTADYARDFAAFRAFARSAAPGMIILGPGSSGEGGDILPADMMRDTAGAVDAISYHFYGALSVRCKEAGSQTTPEEALSEAWLSRTEADYRFYSALRDRFAPGTPIWLSETGQAACGGSPWASTFRDTFRYVDQMGRLARLGVRVVAHNTLAASDYALIDDRTLEPRPSYWAALLWRRLMGTVVLAQPGISLRDVRLYAHCLRGGDGIALLAENLGEQAQGLRVPGQVAAYVMTASSLDSRTVRVNDIEVRAGPDGVPADIAPQQVHGRVRLPSHSIAFLAVTGVSNPACAAGATPIS